MCLQVLGVLVSNPVQGTNICAFNMWCKNPVFLKAKYVSDVLNATIVDIFHSAFQPLLYQFFGWLF